MPGQLAKLFGAGWRHPLVSSVHIADEVSEYAGALLVRLGGGSAMQVRLHAEAGSILIRTVPIAKSTQLDGDQPWQIAADSQLRAWIQSHSAIWEWLLRQGMDGDAAARRIAESGIAESGGATVSPSQRTSTLKSKISLSLT